MPFDLLLPDIPDLQLDQIQLADQMFLLMIRATHPSALCPICGHLSTRIHSCYTRTIADLPWADRMAQLQLHVRRFFCTNPACLRQTFAERLGAAVLPWARRTLRQAQQLQQLAFALGGSAGRFAKGVPMARSSSPWSVINRLRCCLTRQRKPSRIGSKPLRPSRSLHATAIARLPRARVKVRLKPFRWPTASTYIRTSLMHYSVCCNAIPQHCDL